MRYYGANATRTAQAINLGSTIFRPIPTASIPATIRTIRGVEGMAAILSRERTVS